MPSILGSNYLHLCFKRIKIPLTQQQSLPHSELPPSVDDQNRSFTDTILVKNFNSLYDDDQTTIPAAPTTTTTTSNSDSDTDTTTAVTPDFATIYTSQRFFFSSPGRSNSIIDSSASSSSSSSSSLRAVPVLESDPLLRTTNSVAVSKYSPDPYADFRRSMQEIVEARGFKDVQTNWDNLHELLLCYLALNPKSMHKFIVGAFSDLLLTLMPSGGRKADVSGGSCSIKQKLL